MGSVMSRSLEERIVDWQTGTPITEWEPARAPAYAPSWEPHSDKDWREYIRALNREAKQRGDLVRYRSVVPAD